MAEIKPIQAWRYNKSLSTEIESLTSPLFDVVSERQRQKLYRAEYNSIHINLPQPPMAAERAAITLQEWKSKGIIVRDRLPAIYVYYQYFRHGGSSREICRKGFISYVRLHHWEDKVILRHENTIPKSVNDRHEMLEKTELNVSPTHGLYTDPQFILEAYMDEAIQNPIVETEDYQGVRDVLAVIHDARIIHHFSELIKPKRIILADGHHRYEGSLSYMRQQKRSNPHHTGNEGYNFHMMYLTNTEAHDLTILPTHRLLSNLIKFDEAAILQKLEMDFTIKEVDNPDTINEVIAGRKWNFGLLFKDNAYALQLKPGKINSLNWPFPNEVKEIELTVMHYFIIQKGLGIRGKDQRRSENISFDRSLADCLKKVNDGTVQLAIITNEISIEEVKKVCDSGYTMPQKSTYFYPKVICGFLFGSIMENEFKFSPFAPFE